MDQELVQLEGTVHYHTGIAMQLAVNSNISEMGEARLDECRTS